MSSIKAKNKGSELNLGYIIAVNGTVLLKKCLQLTANRVLEVGTQRLHPSQALKTLAAIAGRRRLRENRTVTFMVI